MRVHLRMLGCRLNQGEIDRMARQFASEGHQVVTTAEAADLMVVNTCAVTQEATRTSRQVIRRLHRVNPTARIAVTGCYAHIAPDEVHELPGVSQVIDNFAKESLVSIVTGQPLDTLAEFDREPLARLPLVGASGRTRAFVKVQDGCDRHCSFCLTRLARGPGRSRALGEIVREVQALSGMGYQEAVLTGVHLGSYGHDLGQPEGLYYLLSALLAHTAIPRLRLSSLEPWGISPGFFRLWEDPRLCPHLHLPLQSGCDATLRRMIRRTNQAAFRKIVQEARACIPELSITTDIIVGFPGETDEEFATSRAFIEEMAFAGMHIFRYSARPGTAAARLPHHVSEEVKRARGDVFQGIAQRAESRFAESFIGKTLPVLWEAVSGTTPDGFVNNGYTANYIRVQLTAPEVLTNTITPTRLVGYDAGRALVRGQVAQAVPI